MLLPNRAIPQLYLWQGTHAGAGRMRASGRRWHEAILLMLNPIHAIVWLNPQGLQRLQLSLQEWGRRMAGAPQGQRRGRRGEGGLAKTKASVWRALKHNRHQRCRIVLVSSTECSWGFSSLLRALNSLCRNLSAPLSHFPLVFHPSLIMEKKISILL